jgi:hypothetical protein
MRSKKDTIKHDIDIVSIIPIHTHRYAMTMRVIMQIYPALFRVHIYARSKTCTSSIPSMRLLTSDGLLAKAKRLVTAIESNKLRPEHGITENLHTGTLVTLNTTEAGRVGIINGSESELVAGDFRHVAVANGDRHIGQSGGARVDETTNLVVELRALHLRIVCVGDLLVDEKERGAGIGNGIRALRVLENLITDSELGGGELPETGVSLDGDPSHLALEFGSIDLAELVDTGAIGIKVGGEDRQVKTAHDVVEECFCRGFLGAIVDCVELGECKTDETIGISVLDERLRNLVGKLDSLVLDLDASYSDNIRADDSSGTRAITVADLPL